MTPVLLEGPALEPVSLDEARLWLRLEHDYEDTLISGLDLGDPAVLDISATLAGRALQPLAPVHPRARREAGGVRITFCRRTRSGGDSWALYEVPLGEARPEFRLAFHAGNDRRRSVTLDATDWLYPPEWEQADFGASQTVLDLAICQVSAETGPGEWLRQQVPVL